MPSPRLKQDLQDVQDCQDERQVREDLNVYRISRKQEAKVREDLNVSSGGCVALRGTGPRTTGAEAFFRSAGACPRDRSLILAILIILAILLQTRETLRS